MMSNRATLSLKDVDSADDAAGYVSQAACEGKACAIYHVVKVRCGVNNCVLRRRCAHLNRARPHLFDRLAVIEIKSGDTLNRHSNRGTEAKTATADVAARPSEIETLKLACDESRAVVNKRDHAVQKLLMGKGRAGNAVHPDLTMHLVRHSERQFVDDIWIKGKDIILGQYQSATVAHRDGEIAGERRRSFCPLTVMSMIWSATPPLPSSACTMKVSCTSSVAPSACTASELLSSP